MAEMGAAKKPGLMTKITRFFKDTKAELKKVTWPTKEQLIHNTGIVLAFIIIFTIILSLLDFGFQELFAWFTGLLG
ncbi:MAG: preprotein translocase subunit SecE [Firmicutes bacterium]|nr:preprotein translocase subunit SecE [Bacillota bacterium]